MTDRVEIDWLVPRGPWRRWHEAVLDERGELPGVLSRAAERAMREYIDADRGADVEELAKAVGEAVAPDAMADQGEKQDIGTEDFQGPRKRVQVLVAPGLKDNFKAYAKEHAPDDNFGEVLARAFRADLLGGRDGRIRRSLARIAAAVEADVPEATRDALEVDERPGAAATDAGVDTVDRPPDWADVPLAEWQELAANSRRRKAHRIADRLVKDPETDEFRRDELETATREIAGSSEPTLAHYREAVPQLLGHVVHPRTVEIYVPVETAVKYGYDPDALAIENKPQDAWTIEDKAEALQAALLQKPTDALTTDRARRELNGAAPGAAITAAADADGFGTDDKAGGRLLLKQPDRVDADLRRRASGSNLAGDATKRGTPAGGS